MQVTGPGSEVMGCHLRTGNTRRERPEGLELEVKTYSFLESLPPAFRDVNFNGFSHGKSLRCLRSVPKF
jgi:hypothetical protein